MIIADTSALVAFFCESGPKQEAVAAWLESNQRDIVVSPYVVAEVDYLVATRKGVSAELAVLRELAGGAYVLATVGAQDLATAIDVVDRYQELDIGIADASIAVLADRYRTNTILTLDRRHFGVLQPLSGGFFEVVP
jgi:hypothetical protein